VSGLNSEWRPASRRNRVRLQIGTLSGFKSESASGFIGIPTQLGSEQIRTCRLSCTMLSAAFEIMLKR
jgi:hypothetical protein